MAAKTIEAATKLDIVPISNHPSVIQISLHQPSGGTVS
jgi:hypothetical protein